MMPLAVHFLQSVFSNTPLVLGTEPGHIHALIHLHRTPLTSDVDAHQRKG